MRLPSFVSFRRPSCVIAIVLAALPAGAGAQSSAIVDEGTFMVSQRGTPLGRESFRIARIPAPGGQVFRATGESALGDNRMTTSLGTDSTGVPVSYESKLSQHGKLVQKLEGRGRPGRFSILVQTKGGESAREYQLNSGALLMDEDVFHHFFFVPMAAEHPHVVVIAPRATQQARFTLMDRGMDMVEIAGRIIEGRRFALIDPAGGARDVWIDSKGRLLKVSIPARGLVALRDDPPR